MRGLISWTIQKKKRKNKPATLLLLGILWKALLCNSINCSFTTSWSWVISLRISFIWRSRTAKTAIYFSFSIVHSLSWCFSLEHSCSMAAFEFFNSLIRDFTSGVGTTDWVSIFVFNSSKSDSNLCFSSSNFFIFGFNMST